MSDKLKSLEELSAHPALLKGLAVAQASGATSTPAKAEEATTAPTDAPIAPANGLGLALLPAYRFDYVNYRGEISTREVIPRFIHYGKSEFHPEAQWMMRALDIFKGAERDFAMNDMYPPSFVDKVVDVLEATGAYQENLNATIIELHGAPGHTSSESTETLRQIMVRRVRTLSKHFGIIK